MIGYWQTLSVPTDSPSLNDDVVTFKGFIMQIWGPTDDQISCNIGIFKVQVYTHVSKRAFGSPRNEISEEDSLSSFISKSLVRANV